MPARALRVFKDSDSQAEAKRNVIRAIESVAAQLCESFEQYIARERRGEPGWLQSEEAAVLAVLEQQIKREADQMKAA